MNGYGRGFLTLPPVVKNIILLNGLMLIADWTAKGVFGIDQAAVLGLYFPKSEHFIPVQILTHMFMHANFMHLFFNMFALYMFGGILENVWGPKRFFIYYMVCGLGAAFVHESVIMFQYNKIINTISPENLQLVLNDGAAYLNEGKVFTNGLMKDLQMLLNVSDCRGFRCCFWDPACVWRALPKYRTYAIVRTRSYQGQVFCYWLWGD